jgi:hypothetical protein
VAQDLGLEETKLYPCSTKRQQTGKPFEGQKLQLAELARLKRENSLLEKKVVVLKRRFPYYRRVTPIIENSLLLF